MGDYYPSAIDYPLNINDAAAAGASLATFYQKPNLFKYFIDWRVNASRIAIAQTNVHTEAHAHTHTHTNAKKRF